MSARREALPLGVAAAAILALLLNAGIFFVVVGAAADQRGASELALFNQTTFYAEQAAKLDRIERDLPELRQMFRWFERSKDKRWLIAVDERGMKELDRILEGEPE